MNFQLLWDKWVMEGVLEQNMLAQVFYDDVRLSSIETALVWSQKRSRTIYLMDSNSKT